jgi:hypothetical protein
VRFPLRRQQTDELAQAPEAAAQPMPDPIPFPAQAGAIDPNAGTWDELLRPKSSVASPRMRGQMTSSDARAERLVRQVRGSYTCVVGLPLVATHRLLLAAGVGGLADPADAYVRWLEAQGKEPLPCPPTFP